MLLCISSYNQASTLQITFVAKEIRKQLRKNAMVSGSAYYRVGNQSPSNVRSYESLVAQRKILTASKNLSKG